MGEFDQEQNKNMQNGLLSSIFGGKPTTPADMFIHPLELELLTKTMEKLQKSETGAHLLGVVNEKELGIRVIKNRNVHGYAADHKTIFFGLPPNMTEPDGFAVLELGAAIREIEQEMVGFTLPDDDDPLLLASTRHAKFLDIVVFMCKIAYEIKENTGSDECIKALFKLGHEDTYQAVISEMELEEIASVYENANNAIIDRTS